MGRLAESDPVHECTRPLLCPGAQTTKQRNPNRHANNKRAKKQTTDRLADRQAGRQAGKQVGKSRPLLGSHSEHNKMHNENGSQDQVGGNRIGDL